MSEPTLGEPITYQDLAATIEADLFDPLPFDIDPAWLVLPEIEPEWLELPMIEPEWLELPEIEPEWLAGGEHKHLEIELEAQEIRQEILEVEMADIGEEQEFEDLEL